ncbi:MAG TPA: hypothetical protein VFW40_07385 [Capsulimonadaceae bacterium]|nr:hypothetical protein [Capsulimonadaceae bacterium]
MGPGAPQFSRPRGCNIFLGLVLLLMGAAFFYGGFASFGVNPVGAIFFFLFALLALSNGAYMAFTTLAVSKPVVGTGDSVISRHLSSRRGEVFYFTFSQKLRVPMTVLSVGIYFVYRERALWRSSRGNEGDVPTAFDRLIGSITLPGRRYRAGEMISLAHSFEVPVGEMGLRAPVPQDPMLHDPTFSQEWVVRVRLERKGLGSDIWQDYPIIMSGDGLDLAAPPSSAGDLFDVMYLPSQRQRWMAIMRVMAKVAPYFQNIDQQSVPAPIFERVDGERAEAIAKPLQDASAIINIIPTEATWWFKSGGQGRFESSPTGD